MQMTNKILFQKVSADNFICFQIEIKLTTIYYNFFSSGKYAYASEIIAKVFDQVFEVNHLCAY